MRHSMGGHPCWFSGEPLARFQPSGDRCRQWRTPWEQPRRSSVQSTCVCVATSDRTPKFRRLQVRRQRECSGPDDGFEPGVFGSRFNTTRRVNSRAFPSSEGCKCDDNGNAAGLTTVSNLVFLVHDLTRQDGDLRTSSTRSFGASRFRCK